MELHQLRYFRAVARTGSFTKAAQQEDIAQPSLSEQIRKLEKELDVVLFERLGRSIRITPYGEALLRETNLILNHVESARTTLAALHEGVGGKVRVGVIPTILPYFLAPRVGEFQAKHPGITVELIEDPAARLVERLQAGELDLAIATLPLRNPDIVCRELFREPIKAVVASKHRLAQLDAIDLGDAREERMLLLREGHCLRDDVLTACTRAKVDFDAVFETDQLATIFALVAGGFGISLVPEMAARQAAGCRLIRLERPAFRRVGYALTRSRFPHRPRQLFLEWLKGIRPEQGS